jgi:hypothetical protein
MIFMPIRDVEYAKQRRQVNKKYYETNQYVRENKVIQTRLVKIGPLRRRRWLEAVWEAAAKKQAEGEGHTTSIFGHLPIAESNQKNMRLPVILDRAVPDDLRNYLQSRMHPKDELAMIQDGHMFVGDVPHEDLYILYHLGRHLRIPVEFSQELDKYVAGPPYNNKDVDGEEDKSMGRTLKLRWLLAGVYQRSMEKARKYPESHFPVDKNGAVSVLGTIQRRIHEFVEYRKFERKCLAKGQSSRFMMMLDTHIEFTALDILNLVEMVDENTVIPPYVD